MQDTYSQQRDAASALSPQQQARQHRMSVLANAPKAELIRLWNDLDLDPGCELLRGPETGLVALRGRIGGGGAPFNFGEATITRATVRMENGVIGHALMLGRDHGKAKLAAVIDALASDPAMSERIEASIIAPLHQLAEREARKQGAETQATRVNFFTMVRGDD
ncbi:phosphonate C-P lyase system protein PhnG [uncultured Cohaesibacter sp.]|uniref:phosphonate C-P lyase system protein PhnG n=1 Tax=uncultured Cohaesibacter sp. TaxID=1002546 RepID=UPI0029C8DF8D|nr:phosphonate C-P lyase system protein PhnG [uncultured Cohaesibacter sp.]